MGKRNRSIPDRVSRESTGTIHHVERAGMKIATCGQTEVVLSTPVVALVSCGACRAAIRADLVGGA